MVVGDEIFAMCISQFVVLVEAEGIIFPGFENILGSGIARVVWKFRPSSDIFQLEGNLEATNLRPPPRTSLSYASYRIPSLVSRLTCWSCELPTRIGSLISRASPWNDYDYLVGRNAQVVQGDAGYLCAYLPIAIAGGSNLLLVLCKCAIDMNSSERKERGVALTNNCKIPFYYHRISYYRGKQQSRGTSVVAKYPILGVLSDSSLLGALDCTLLWAVRCFCW